MRSRRRAKWYRCSALAAALAFGAASPAGAVIYGPNGQGNFNAYRMYDDSAQTARTWDQSRVFANTTTFMGLQGHLVTMGSDEELLFVANIGGSGMSTMGQGNAGGGTRWIGLTDATAVSSLDGWDPVAELGTFEAGNTSGLPLPTPGNVPVSGQRGFGWKWVDNTPFTHQAWAGGEPNNSGGEDAAHLNGAAGLWNDNKAGTTIGETANTTGMRALVEYNTNTPMFSQTQQLQAWQATVWKVQDVQTPAMGPTVTNLAQAKEVFAGTRGPLDNSFGVAGVANGTFATINFKEHATSGNAGYIQSPADVGLPGFGSTQLDHFAVRATGSFSVTGGGDFTFGVNSDDGFGLTIRDSGGGTVDFLEWSGQSATTIAVGELQFPNGRGAQTNVAGGTPASYGRVALPDGDYTFELINWDGTGGSSLEAFFMSGLPTGWTPSSTTGPNFNQGTFQLIGTDTMGIDWSDIDVEVRKLAFTPQVNYPDITNMTQADQVIAGTFPAPLHGGFPKSAYYDVLNLNDADNSNLGNFLDNEDPFFGVRGQDDFVLQATGLLVIPESGLYTFGAASDDGVRLRLDINGDGVFDDSDNVFLLASGTTANIMGTVDLEAGYLMAEVTYFERGGGAHLEIYSALGEHTAFNANDFRLVGDFANGGLMVLQQPLPIPEPATGALLVGAMGVLGLRMRRRREA